MKHAGELRADVATGETFPLADGDGGLAEPETFGQDDGGLGMFIRLGQGIGEGTA